LPILEHTGRQGLDVGPGEIVSVLGAPGSGKTELALELAFLKVPSHGEVLLRGINPLAQRRFFQLSSRPHDVTLLVQNAEDQLFARTVYDDVAFGPRHLGVAEDEVERRVIAALEAVGLGVGVRARSPFALSGGERRRVALAGVLAMEPVVLVLDEPTANLDPQARNEFLRFLAPLRGKSAIVWLTDSAREATLADRIYLLQNGMLQPVPAREALLTDWRRLAEAGIELPAVFQLARALDERGLILPPEGTPEAMRQAIINAWCESHAG